MNNAEKKLDGAEYFLDILRDNLNDPRAFHHSAEALLNNVYAVGAALEDEMGEEGIQRYKKWRAAWRDTLTKEEQLLVDEILRLRGEGVHNAAGISLSISGVRLTSNTLDNPATILVHKEGTFSAFQVSVSPHTKGLFEDESNEPLSPAELLAPGQLNIHTQVSSQGDSTTDLTTLPEWRFKDSKLRQDVLSACAQVFDITTRFLRDFRAGHK